MKVLLDTNFLVYCAKQKIDYNEEIGDLVKGKYDLVVIDKVRKELEKLKKNARKYVDKQAANLALQLLEVNEVKEMETEEKHADEALIANCKDNLVATLDLDLARKVDRGIIIRGRRKLSFR